MQIAIIGLGRMGGNMARRLARGGVEVLGYDPQATARDALRDERSVRTVESVAALIDTLSAPRIVWLMLPAGEITNTMIDNLSQQLSRGDLVVNGANALYKEAAQHAQLLAARGIEFVDAGVSGGIWGLEVGYCLMLGGTPAAVARLAPYARILAPENGWLHCGPHGAGHFVKMIHNGIEYGMMQAYAEGFALLAGQKQMDLDVAAISELWRHGSVVRSWLLDLSAEMLKHPNALGGVQPFVADSGEGRWTVNEAIEQGTPAPVISLALMSRFSSQGAGDLANRMLALMRKQFGGHAIKKT